MLSHVKKDGLLPDDEHFVVDEVTCLRYLRMKGGNKEKALKRLEATIAWRAETKPHRIAQKEVAHLLDRGDVMLCDSPTRNGAGLVFFKARDNAFESASVAEQKLFQAWYYEEMMRRGFREVCCIVDFNNMSKTPSSDEMKAQKELDDVDERHYPLFASKTLMVHMPLFLRAVVTVYTAFWPEHQKRTLETNVQRHDLHNWIDSNLIPNGFAVQPEGH